MGNCVSKKNADLNADSNSLKKNIDSSTKPPPLSEDAAEPELIKPQQDLLNGSAPPPKIMVTEEPEVAPIAAAPPAPPDFAINRLVFEADVQEEHLSDNTDHRDVSDTSEQDKETLEVTKRDQCSFKQLIWELIYSRHLTDPLDKIRAIFLWLCTKDLNAVHFNAITSDSCKDDDPEKILLLIKEGKTSYADAFTLLCAFAEVKSAVIRGYAKGSAFAPGVDIARCPSTHHAWNAVFVNDKWYLIDCHWAARRLVGKEPTLDSCNYYLDDFYYLPSPDHLKYTHHPFETKWQLTKNPLTIEEFEKYAPVRSSFFKYELSLLSHKNGFINCESLLIVKIGFPQELLHKLAFTCSLRQEMDDGTTSDVSNYGINELVSDTPPIEAFTFRLPREGIYRLLLYVRHVDNKTFGTAVDYRIKATFSQEKKAPLPFPPTQQNSYGPSEIATKFNITCNCPNQAVITLKNGYTDIEFSAKDGTNSLPHLLGQLKGMNLKDDILSQFVLQRLIRCDDDGDGKSQNKIVFSAFLPLAGEFALEIYGNNDSDNEDDIQYFLVWQFLLRGDTAYPHGSVPVLPGNIIGPLTNFAELGLKTLSHTDPFIRLHEGDVDEYPRPKSDLAIDIALPPVDPTTGYPKVRVIAQLTSRSGGQGLLSKGKENEEDEEENLTEYVLQQVKDNILTCFVRFPKAALFKLHLYAHPLPDIDDSVPVVFTYLIDALPRLHTANSLFIGCVAGQFPKQSNKWKEGAILHEPMSAGLVPRSNTKFSIEICRAKDVVVVIGEKVFHLENETTTGDSGTANTANNTMCLWTGNVTLPSERDCKISVCGRWTVQTSNYPTLLEYKIKDQQK